MRINRIYMLLCLVVLATLALLVWVTLSSDMGLYFVLAQLLVVVTLLLLAYLYFRTIKPLRTIISGVDLLNAQDFSTRLQHVKQRDIDHIVDLFNRLLQQLKDERLRVREKNEQLDILINASPMGVVILDLDDNISLINPSACSILGCDESISRLTDVEGYLAVELSGLELDSSKVVHLSDGNIFKCTHSSFVVSGFKRSFFLIEKMTEELLFAERKAYEQVIRMIAHEVNNSMAGVSSAVELVQGIIEQQGDKEIADILATSSRRCISLSHFISRFADVVKIPEPILNEIELNTFVVNNSKLYESMAMGRDILVKFTLSSEPITVSIDVAQMGQVMLNIIKNALEAIRGSGVIEISTFHTPPSIVVSNNGEVIPLESERNLFSPFYSTKPKGQGIGLMIIREVLIKHNFRYSLSTDQLGVTNFVIYF